MISLTGKESLIIARLQEGLPFIRSPFKAMASEAGLSVQELLNTIRDLKEREIIRDISGIFDGSRLGYTLSLVAFRVEDNIDQAGHIISGHPGVSHNYLRDHYYNIWFTLAEENRELFDSTIDILAEKSSASKVLVFRNEEIFKIGVMLPVGESIPVKKNKKALFEENFLPLNSAERAAVRVLQEPVPLVENPFAVLAEKADAVFSEEELLSMADSFLKRGILRRYAAVIRHRKAGYKKNAMTAWKLPGDMDVTEVINPFLQERAVTHLYRRTVYPGEWEYALFAMLHAHTGDDLMSLIKRLSAESGLADYEILESLHEYKKQRVRYFAPEFEIWRKENL